MHDHDSYPVHRCAFAAVFAVFVVLFVAHATRRFRQFPVHGEPAPRPHDIKPICSFDVLRDIASKRADGFVSGNGTWKRQQRRAGTFPAGNLSLSPQNTHPERRNTSMHKTGNTVLRGFRRRF